MNIDISFASALARSGFQHRATHRPDGTVVYRLADGSGYVKVPRERWNELGERFKNETRAIRWRANIYVVALLPAILIYGFTLAQVIPGGGLGIVIAFFGGPIAIYLWQSSKVQKVGASIEACLGELPQTAPPPPSPGRPPRWLDIVCILMVGPWLILALIGEIGGPETYRNTPLKGMHLGVEAWAAIGALALRLAWPRLAPLFSRARRGVEVGL